MMKHEQTKLKALSDPDVKAEYDALEPEFALLREMLSVREKNRPEPGGNSNLHGNHSAYRYPA